MVFEVSAITFEGLKGKMWSFYEFIIMEDYSCQMKSL